MDEARNLDYLLAVCVKQHSGGDLESFLKDVAPHIGQAAPWLKIGGGGGGLGIGFWGVLKYMIILVRNPKE